MIADLKPYPEYKPTRIDWLDRLPEDWEELSLKRIAQVENSGCYGDEPENGRIVLPVATTAQIDRDGNFAITRMPKRGFAEEEAARFCCKPGDILVVKSSGSAANVISGKAGIVRSNTPPFVFSNFLMRFVARQIHVQPEFLFLLVTCNLTRERVKRMVSTTTYPNLRVGEYCSALLPIPPSKEQSTIVRFLDWANGRLERAVRAKRMVIALFNEQKQAIIHRAVTRGLDHTVRLKPSGVEWLGDIPEHWGVRRAKDLFREVDIRSTTGKEVLLSLRMYRGLVPHHEVSTIPITAPALIGFKKVTTGQIVMNRMRAAIGMFGLVDQPGLVSPDYAVLEPGELVEANYFLHLFKTRAAGTAFRMESKGLGTGSSGFMRLYTDRFGIIKLPVPTRDEQRTIVQGLATKTARPDHAISRTIREISLLREYRTRLIADVVTGQVDVREAARHLPAEAEQPETNLEAGDLADDADTPDMTEEEVSA